MNTHDSLFLLTPYDYAALVGIACVVLAIVRNNTNRF
jgi:hypothetical protein